MCGPEEEHRNNAIMQAIIDLQLKDKLLAVTSAGRWTRREFPIAVVSGLWLMGHQQWGIFQGL